ncbi:hypothetical protein [Arsenicicoccus sp. oral taxon 190]|uniref:hypothetical protein n=1 Tax=Arsenicicoccus sp. oral taxon 190 TaxID=1658671 RepID=UPI00067BCC80|nr:hypothetical protein [Arsenicicoccus sp. oral taxon 190]
MQNKLSFLAGLAVGYVAGARAGRTRYEQIKRQSAKAWQSEPVQQKVAEAADAVKAKTPGPAHKLVDKAVDAVSGGTTPASTQTTSQPSRTTTGGRTPGSVSGGPGYTGNPVGMPGVPADSEANGHPS